MEEMRKFQKTLTMFVLGAFLLMAAGCTAQEVAETPSPVPTDVPTDVPPTVTPEPGISCALPLPASEDWEVVLCEDFNDNAHGWQEETQDNPYSAYTSAVAGGKFVVDYRAKSFAGFTQSAVTWFDVVQERNFVLSITGQIDSPFAESNWGIAFRGNDESFFLFSLQNDDTYIFEVYEDNRWLPLITRKQTNVINVGEPNTLRVEAAGGDFYFSINGETVNQFSGAALPGDAIQIVVSAKEGASAVFTFDDIVIQK